MALRNFTLPVVSILNAKSATTTLIKEFGQQRIEDLPIPFFGVACNLNQSLEVVWQQGEVWRKVRSSVSIPGLIPPMVEDGELYVDGGVVNNLPVDAMRRVLSPRGVVIAVDASSSGPDEQRYHFPPVFSFVESLLTLLKLKNRSYKFPHFGETMLKSLSMGAQLRVEMNRAEADLLIQPTLGTIGMMDVERGQSLIETSYQETKQQLDKLSGTPLERVFMGPNLGKKTSQTG